MEQAFGQRTIICLVAQNRGRFALRKDGSPVPLKHFVRTSFRPMLSKSLCSMSVICKSKCLAAEH